LKVELQTEIPLDIHYSFDETNPDEFYPKYEKTFDRAERCIAFETDHIQGWSTNRQTDQYADRRVAEKNKDEITILLKFLL
jgi:hypothetical protein